MTLPAPPVPRADGAQSFPVADGAAGIPRERQQALTVRHTARLLREVADAPKWKSTTSE